MTDAEMYGHDAVYVPPARKVAAFVPVTDEMFLDAGRCLWLAPDPCPIPPLDLFPRTRRFARRVARLLEVGK